MKADPYLENIQNGVKKTYQKSACLYYIILIQEKF